MLDYFTETELKVYNYFNTLDIDIISSPYKLSLKLKIAPRTMYVYLRKLANRGCVKIEPLPQERCIRYNFYKIKNIDLSSSPKDKLEDWFDCQVFGKLTNLNELSKKLEVSKTMIKEVLGKRENCRIINEMILKVR